MKDQLKLIPIPFHYKNYVVKFVMVGYEPYLLASDILEPLGFSSQQFLQDYLDICEYTYAFVKIKNPKLEGLNEFENKLLISQSGIFSLLQVSVSPDAGNFRRWLVKEVYPFILKSILDLSIYSQSLTCFKIEVSLAKYALKQAEKRLTKALIEHEIANQILPLS